MDIWTITDWKKYYGNVDRRHGIKLTFDDDVDPVIRTEVKDLCRWLRNKYYFPIRVSVCIKSDRYVTDDEQDSVNAAFFPPDDTSAEPNILLATGGFDRLCDSRGMFGALSNYLWLLLRELTHYYQWINRIKLTPLGADRQRSRYANLIIKDYTDQEYGEFGEIFKYL